MEKMDKLALNSSEILAELEKIEFRKRAEDNLSKVLSNPTVMNNPKVQETVSNSIKEQLNKSDDGSEMHFKKFIKSLEDAELVEFCELAQKEIKARGLDEEELECEENEDEECDTEDLEDEEEADDMKDEMLHYVTASLNDLSRKAADEGNIEAAYMIERAVQKISSR